MHVYRNLSSLPAFKNAVVTIGSFDGVHAGHRRILEQVCLKAKAIGGESVVVTFDPHPRHFFASASADFNLLTTTEEKAKLLDDCHIDHLVVVPFDQQFASLSADAYVDDFLLSKLRPKAIIIGYDHRFGRGRAGDLNFLLEKTKNLDIEIVEITKHEIEDIAVSSSKIRKALQNGDIGLANRLLTTPFSFSGLVVQGKQIGRTIGFPTANLVVLDPYKIVPKSGIYAAKAHLASEKSYSAMLYIGNRPTLDDKRGQTIEANLLDFNENLYGQIIRIEPLGFIREDKELGSLEALKEQISLDKSAIQSLIACNRQAEYSESHFQMTKKMSEKKQKKIAVVILNYNTQDQLLEFLPSVLAYSTNAEIVVADNGSPDASCTVVKEHFPQVTLIELPENYGFAGGYNEALKQVKADYYVLLNSDVEVTQNWLDAPIELMEKQAEVAVVQPKILALKRKTHFEHAGAAAGWMDALSYPFCRGRIFAYTEKDEGQYDTAQECFWAAGAAFFVRAELYHSFGGFDADYFAHNEEIDLCWRLKRAGYSVWCTPASVVYHLGGGTLDYDSPRKVYLNFRNSLFSIIKNEPAGMAFFKVFARLFLDGLAGLRFALKGQFASIWAVIRAHFSLYRQSSMILAKRKETAILVEKHRIGPENKAGIYKGSIVWRHYLGRVKEFSEVFSEKI